MEVGIDVITFATTAKLRIVAGIFDNLRARFTDGLAFGCINRHITCPVAVFAPAICFTRFTAIGFYGVV